MFKLFAVLILGILLISCVNQNETKFYDTHSEAMNKINTKIQIDSVFNVDDWQYSEGYRLELKFMSAMTTKYSLWHRDGEGMGETFSDTYYISINTKTKRINSVWLP